MKFNWNLPQDWCHSGAPQANGLFGTMLWGDCNTLKLTVNRSDYWFRGDNLPPNTEQSYKNLKKNLQNGNKDELLRVFAGSIEDDFPLASTRLPVGRLLIDLPQGCTTGELNLDIASSLAEANLDKMKVIVPRELAFLALSISGESYQECSFSVKKEKLT